MNVFLFDKLARVCVRKAMPAIGLGLFLLLFCQPAFSQSNLGRISGGITDQTGGAIANAAVTVTDVDRGLARPLMTDSSGQYSAGSLIPGNYMVRAEAQGFRALERRDIIVGVGQDVRVDLVLQPGAQSETITVTGELPMINTSNAVLGGQIENRFITELPLTGRNFLHLIDYQPGMISGDSGNMSTHSSNGNRTDANVWVIDGLYSGDVYTGWSVVNGKISGGGADPSTTLPLDGILELNTQAQPKAEWGYKPGAVVQVGLKSGTNALHGSLFAFGSDKSFRARNAFNPAPDPKAPYAMTQWGGSVGGPIIRDKLFYFGSLERMRYNVGAAVAVDAPTVASMGGDEANSIPDALADMVGKGITPSQLSMNLAGCGSLDATALTGLSASQIAAGCSVSTSVFNNGTDLGEVNLSFPTVGGSTNYMGKVDYRANDRHTFNGTYFSGHGTSLAWRETTQPYWRVNAKIRSYMARGVWIWTPTTSLLSEARFGYNRLQAKILNNECLEGPNWEADYGFVQNDPPLATDPQLGLPYDDYGCTFPVTTISGFGTLNQQNGSGPVLTNPHNFQGLESISWTRGTHQFKFGVESHWIRFVGTGGGGPGPRVKGVLGFQATPSGCSGCSTSLEAFLAGRINTASIQIGPIVRNISQHYYGAFIQDDWRITPRITVNLGVRYEYQSAYRDRDNLIGNFDPTVPSGLRQQTDDRSVWNADKNNFSPRAGVAWDVRGNGTTVVRLGAGLLYSATNFSPFSEIQTVPTGGIMVDAYGNEISPGGTNITAVVASDTPFNWKASTDPTFTPADAVFAFAGSSTTPRCGNGLRPLVDPDDDGIFTVATSGARNPSPCDIFAIEPNLYTPYVTNWSLSIQQAFGSRVSMDFAYVGNHATGLRTNGDLNQPAPGPRNSTSAPQQIRRPYTANCPGQSEPGGAPGGVNAGLLTGGCFPWIGKINYFSNIDMSNYSSFQSRLTMRNWRGLSSTVAFTFQKALQQYDGNENVITSSPLMSNSRPRLDYGFRDTPWNLAASLNYDIPGIDTPAQLLEGWAVNAALRLRGASYNTVTDTSADVSGTGTRRDRWSLFGDGGNFILGGLNRVPCYGITGSSYDSAGCTEVAIPSGATTDLEKVANLPAACIAGALAQVDGPATVKGLVGGATADVTVPNRTGLSQLARLGCFEQRGAAIVPPAQGTFGTMSPGAVRGGTFRNLNLSITKRWTFRERYTAQFRAEIHNVLNRTQYGGGSYSYSSPASGGIADDTPNTGDGIVVGDGGARAIQFGLKLGF